MSHDAEIYGSTPGGRRERPWLLPSNRKLRHLQSISVRNLTITPPSNRARGKTIDDDDLPYTLKSPAKLLAQSEARTLQHSRSSTDLKSPPKGEALKKSQISNEKVDRPGLGKLRRRSTLHWTGASPSARQKRLEDVAAGRMADTWFSLHCQAIDEPVYVSEVIEKGMNPSFRSFDLDACGPLVTRQDDLTVKLWAKTEALKDYILLVELRLNLRSLQFIGKTLESFHHPMPPNCILFHLSDGVYTNFTDIPADEPSTRLMPAKSPHDGVQNTSSYDALMRLANLDDCIQDALATRQKLESQINSILGKNKESLNSLSEVEQAKEQLSSTKRAVSAERKQLRQAIKRREELNASLKARREAMQSGRLAQDKAQSHLSGAQSKIKESKSLVEKNTEESAGQIRRICEDLLTIFPIDPIPNKPLAFTIGRLLLPNSSFEDIDKDEVAAALGFTSQLVYLLSFYLSMPLPYPIQPYSSNSFIQDPISVSIAQRTYPLYPSNVQYRFEYGVFLLNKDLEFLMSRHGLRVIDIRHTLPNLKYLLYVLTAGIGELPARKAGGVKGLFVGRVTPSLSRQGSDDSVASAVGFNTRKLSDGTQNSDSNGAIFSDKGKERADASAANVSYSSPTRKTFPLRTSGLREAF